MQKANSHVPLANRILSKTNSGDKSLHHRLSGLEYAFHAAPIGLCVLDLNFRYMIVNAVFARMYGLQEQDFLGFTVAEVLPGPASQILAHLREALVANSVVEREISLTNPKSADTTPVCADLVYLRTAQPVRDEDGLVFGLSVALLDITGRKRTESALQESEENLRHTVELTPHIPWTADTSGEITFMSPRWQTITGTHIEKVLLKDWADALHPGDLENTAAIWSCSVQTGEPYDAEYRIRSGDGTWRWVRARAYPRLSASGQIIRWYGTVEDVHERKTTAMRLQDATDELSRLAKEDHLTGFPNRRRFDEVLAREMSRATRTKLPLALILIDIDYFKRYNDICGHLAGDECLKAVSKALDGVIRRPADLVARFGGEEFAMILPDTTATGALEIASRAVDAVRRIRFKHLDARVRQVTVSAGVAILLQESLTTGAVGISKLIEAADAALYEAKANGRDQVVSASETKVPV